jgi:GT2 family glycosyltransferase
VFLPQLGQGPFDSIVESCSAAVAGFAADRFSAVPAIDLINIQAESIQKLTSDTDIADPARSTSESSLPPTSLILCSRNRPRLLANLVESILEGQEVPTELLIIDDSDDCHEELSRLKTPRPCEIRYHWNRSRGLGRANNTGLAAARHDIVVFTQDDVLVSPTWFGILVRRLIECGPGAVVTGKILSGEAEVEEGFAPSTVEDTEPKVFTGRIGRDVLFLQNFACYRSQCDEVGGFDPWLGPGTPFPSAEDNEFGYRLLKAGYRIVYEPRAVTTHRAWRSEEDQISLNWNYGRGQGGFFGKHLSLHNPYILGRLLKGVGYMGARACVRVWYRPRRAAYDVVYVAGLLSGTLDWLVRRRLFPGLLSDERDSTTDARDAKRSSS